MRNTPNSDSTSPATQVRIILVVVFLAYAAQMTLNPVIAPLSREVHLAEWHVGIMVSTAAVMVVLTSQFWGRRSQSWGSRPVLVAAMAILTFSMMIFTVVYALARAGQLSQPWVIPLFVLTRGVLFGGALAAVFPTAQTFITRVTSSEAERVNGMASIGAIQGFAMIAGAVVGGLLAGISLFLSIASVPVLMAMGLGIAFLMLPNHEPGITIPKPPRISPFDHRVGPFLLAGFGMFTSLGFTQFVTGFLIQDRYLLDANTTGMVAGLTLLASGVTMIIAQGLVIPHLNWSPTTLLRVGTAIGVLGFGLLLIHGPMWLLVAATAIVTFGIALGMPGYTAGPTLLMDPEEQGGLAGLIGATNGLTFVIAPTLSTSLYAVWPNLPIMIAGGVLFLVFIMVSLHPRFRRMPSHTRSTSPQSPVTEPPTTDA